MNSCTWRRCTSVRRAGEVRDWSTGTHRFTLRFRLWTGGVPWGRLSVKHRSCCLATVLGRPLPSSKRQYRRPRSPSVMELCREGLSAFQCANVHSRSDSPRQHAASTSLSQLCPRSGLTCINAKWAVRPLVAAAPLVPRPTHREDREARFGFERIRRKDTGRRITQEPGIE